MEDAGRKKRWIMLGELLEHMEGAQEVASGIARERPEYAAMAEAVRGGHGVDGVRVGSLQRTGGR